MNLKSTERKQKSRIRNDLIFFAGFHFLVWMVMYFLFGWWGMLAGFLINGIMDTVVLLSWMWQENRHLSRKYKLGSFQH